MSPTMIVYAVVLVAVLLLVFLIVKWKNLPKVIEQERLQDQEAHERRNERIEARQDRRGRVIKWLKRDEPES